MKKIVSVVLALVLCAVSALAAFAESGAVQSGYVLMNIPFDKFYAADATNASRLDAVSSSTLMKPRTAGLSGGSYHVDPAGSDISGVIFPVYVEDLSVLPSLGGNEITDESSVDITVTNKGQESTTTFAGKDALFEAPSYSWYVLPETPVVYKTLNAADLSFSALNAEPVTLEGSASLIYDRHAEVVIKVDGADAALADKNVSGAILVLEDGSRFGLRHIANLWRKTEIGFALDGEIGQAVIGKTISRIEYITTDAVYAVNVNFAVPADERLLKLTGNYIELFPEFAKEEYKDYWMECIKTYVPDDTAAETYYTMLTQTYMGRLKGQEAIDAYSADSSSMLFDCFFENGVAKFFLSGDIISGVDSEGKEIFRHVYHYAEDLPAYFFGQETGTSLHIYKTDDTDAGAFTYFAFADDTLGETYHIEFRYGENIENLANYSEGEYAYWLAAGINDGYKDKQIQACIKLFVDENVGGQGEQGAEDSTGTVIEISTAEELAAINNNLSASYVLTADIDLGGAEWTPIGSFVQLGSEGEEAETPNPEYAFTGTFDGQGHIISNFQINQPEGWAVGLFGAVSNAQIGNFILKNVKVTGTTIVGGVVGYAFCSTVYDVKAEDITVTGNGTEMSEEGMYGGIVGAGMASMIKGCSANANIIVPDNSGNGGIVGGGLEMTNAVDCTASGSVTAGNNCYGIGGISGCGFAAEVFTDNTAENVTITVGDNCFWIGGITGYAGGFEDEILGMPVTAFTGCKVNGITITAGEKTEGVGAIVGAGFFREGLAEAYGVEAYANPTVFTLTDCESSNVTLNGETVE